MSKWMLIGFLGCSVATSVAGCNIENCEKGAYCGDGRDSPGWDKDSDEREQCTHYCDRLSICGAPQARDFDECVASCEDRFERLPEETAELCACTPRSRCEDVIDGRCTGSGGQGGSGGTSATGGSPGQGGAYATGGSSNNGGSPETGGSPATGGTWATGGSHRPAAFPARAARPQRAALPPAAVVVPMPVAREARIPARRVPAAASAHRGKAACRATARASSARGRYESPGARHQAPHSGRPLPALERLR